MEKHNFMFKIGDKVKIHKEFVLPDLLNWVKGLEFDKVYIVTFITIAAGTEHINLDNKKIGKSPLMHRAELFKKI